MKKKAVKNIFILLLLIVLIFNNFTSRISTLITAVLNGLATDKFYKLIKAESSFRCFAYSPKKAIGLGQIRVSTSKYIEPDIPPIFLWFPPINLHISAKYMKYLLKKYNQNWSVALAAYNWGETNVDKRLAQLKIKRNIDYRQHFKDIKETYHYIKAILD